MHGLDFNANQYLIKETKIMKKHLILIAVSLALAMAVNLKAVDKSNDKMQRQATDVFDFQRNTVSNFDFISSNFGIIGLDAENNTGSGIWPRGSQNQYLYASGFWFGAMKKNPATGELGKLVEVSYNPNSGKSWFSPGRVEDGTEIDSSLSSKYRIYFSTDFNNALGEPFNHADGPNWPLWKDGSLPQYHYGTYKYNYINDVNLRNIASNPTGPLFVSDEDIFSTFKDTDLNYFEGGQSRKEVGYPLGLQVESSIYTWNSEEMKDVVIISYIIENTSQDTLIDCWVGGVYDVDIGLASNGQYAAGNDYSRFYNEDPSKNLAVAWTASDRGEAGKGFGYIGISMIETPAKDENGFIRNDKLIFEPSEQIGLKTYRDWDIADDKNTDDERYTFISGNAIDPYNLMPGDKRIFIATGPFNMKPGDKAHVAFSITFALPAKGGEADGTTEDLEGFKNVIKGSEDQALSDHSSLIGKLQYAEALYYNHITGVTDNSVSEIENSVYPNPAVDFINLPEYININNDLVKIISQDGKVVKEIYTNGKIDVSNLNTGVYFVKVNNKIMKFVKK